MDQYKNDNLKTYAEESLNLKINMTCTEIVDKRNIKDINEKTKIYDNCVSKFVNVVNSLNQN